LVLASAMASSSCARRRPKTKKPPRRGFASSKAFGLSTWSYLGAVPPRGADDALSWDAKGQAKSWSLPQAPVWSPYRRDIAVPVSLPAGFLTFHSTPKNPIDREPNATQSRCKRKLSLTELTRFSSSTASLPHWSYHRPQTVVLPCELRRSRRTEPGGRSAAAPS